MTSELSAHQVRLRNTKEPDLRFVMRAEREASRFVLEWNRGRHIDAIKSANWDHLIVTSVTGEPVGFVLLSGITDSDRCLNLKRIVITEQGKGYGRAVMRLVLARAFDEYAAHRLWLDVRTDNDRAQALYSSEGFVKEGILRECDRVDDHYESLIIMSILEQEYRARQT